MTNVATIMHKELKSYFTSPVFYVMALFFLISSGATFALVMSNKVPPLLIGTFIVMVYLLYAICPVLTMHLFADERRTGTIELLMTYPLRDWEVVFGKYLASLVILAIMVLCTIEFPIFLMLFGKPDPGPMLTGYLGFILLSASFLAIGVLGSSLSKSQMLAFMISLGIIFGMVVLGLAGAGIGGGRVSNALQYLDGMKHFKNMASGVIDTRDILYFLSLIVFCLFTAVRIVEIKRWK